MDRQELIDSYQTGKRDFPHVDLEGVDLSDVKLSNANLKKANLSNADLSNADLSKAFLSRTKLIDADLSKAILSNADLSNADLSKAILSRTKLIEANLSKAILSNADLSNADLSYANLSNADLSNADLSYADLSYANLSNANLSNADLSNADLSNADLSNAVLNYTCLANLTINEGTQINSKWHLVWEIVTQGAKSQNLSNADLNNANLSRSDLSDANISSADLSDANLSSADLSNADLNKANLSATNLNKANLSDANLSNANLSDANLSNANLSDANLSNANLSDANLSNANLSDANFYKANLSNTNLSNANLSDANFYKANLSNTNLSNAKLSDANLSDANLSDANLNSANLQGFNLSSTNLSNGKLQGADLSKARLHKTQLTGADLTGAYLKDAILTYADLEGANLTGANLIGADLTGAYLKDADLTGAYLKGAKLIGAILKQTNLSSANLTYTLLSNVQDLKTANLHNTNFCGANQFDDKNNPIIIADEFWRKITEDNETAQNGPNELFEAIKGFLKENFNLKLSLKGLKKLINLAFIVSCKKEETRYPKFKLYVPIEKETKNNPISKLIISLNEPIVIDLNNLSPFGRFGNGTPQKFCALLVEEEDSTLTVSGIIKIHNEDEVFRELLNHQMNLSGLLLSVEAPGRINILCNSKQGLKVQFSLNEGKIKINYDALDNPVSNILLSTFAKNIKDQELKNKETPSKEIYDFFELRKIIHGVWYRILKLATDFNYGGQFIIITSKNCPKKYLNIGHFTKENDVFKKIIMNFWKLYCEYQFSKKSSKSNLNEELIHSYYDLLNYIDLLAYLSTIDGGIIMNDNFEFVGFQAEIKIKEDDLIPNYLELQIKPSLEMFWFRSSRNRIHDPYTEDSERTELINKFLNNELTNGEEPKWKSHHFGTRHRSAARLCTIPMLNSFVFVVSQTGDIREFIHMDKESKKVGILGPLRLL